MEILILGALNTNCYLVYDEKSHEAVVIDPADAAEYIAEKVAQMKLTVKALIATHGHFDHNLAAGELQMMLNNVPFFIHKDDLFLLHRMNDSASHWLKYKHQKPLPQVIKHLQNDEVFSVGDSKLTVIEAAGHTPGSICLYTKYKILDTLYSILFSGDTLFKSAIGRYDFSYSDKTKLDQSLKNLFKLPGETIVYPGHGEKTTIAQEKNL